MRGSLLLEENTLKDWSSLGQARLQCSRKERLIASQRPQRVQGLIVGCKYSSAPLHATLSHMICECLAMREALQGTVKVTSIAHIAQTLVQ